EGAGLGLLGDPVGELGEGREPVVQRRPARVEGAVGGGDRAVVGGGRRRYRSGEARGGGAAEGGEVLLERVLGALERARQLGHLAGDGEQRLPQLDGTGRVEAGELDEVGDVGDAGGFLGGHDV